MLLQCIPPGRKILSVLRRASIQVGHHVLVSSCMHGNTKKLRDIQGISIYLLSLLSCRRGSKDPCKELNSYDCEDPSYHVSNPRQSFWFFEFGNVAFCSRESFATVRYHTRIQTTGSFSQRFCEGAAESEHEFWRGGLISLITNISPTMPWDGILWCYLHVCRVIMKQSKVQDYVS